MEDSVGVEVEIQPVNETDLDFLWRMLYFASHSYEESGVESEHIRTNPDLVSYIEDRRGLPGVVAETKESLVGAAWLRGFRRDDASNPVCVDVSTPELAIAVLPPVQGRGVGSALLDSLIAAMPDEIPAIVLSSRAENPAVRLYERQGFVIVGTFVNRVGTRSVKMVRDL